jgi:hypothetical protein
MGPTKLMQMTTTKGPWKRALLLIAAAALLATPALAQGNGNGNGNGHPNGGPPGQAGSLIKFDQRVFTVFEAAGEAVISVERFHGDEGAVTVDYWTEDGSATEGEDYVGIAGTLTWADGENDREVLTIEILDDAAFEVRETVLLHLEIVDGDAQLHPGQGSAVLQILDGNEDGGDDGGEEDPEDPGDVEFTDDPFQVAEDGTAAGISVERDGGSFGAVSVSWATADGGATAGDDYEAASGMLSWADGETGLKTFEVPILEDDLEEGNESVLLTLSDPVGGVEIGGEGDSELLILDNDAEELTCVEDDETLCLADDRFMVRVDWRTPQGDSGPGIVEEVSDNAGLVWFFNPDNKEMLIKVLDACEQFDTYWVFFAATTNVDFTVTVTDTATGLMKEYTNTAGEAAEPVQDTFTFACGG